MNCLTKIDVLPSDVQARRSSIILWIETQHHRLRERDNVVVLFLLLQVHPCKFSFVGHQSSVMVGAKSELASAIERQAARNMYLVQWFCLSTRPRRCRRRRRCVTQKLSSFEFETNCSSSKAAKLFVKQAISKKSASPANAIVK